MKIRIRNTKDQKSYDVDVNEVGKTRYLRRPKPLTDEEICDKCGKKLSECVCDKSTADEKKEENKSEKIELTAEQLEQFEELVKLLPDLKKLLKGESKEKEEKKEEKEPKEEAEKESKKEEKPEEEEKEAAKKGDEAPETNPTQEEESSEILLEGSEDNTFDEEQNEFEEEDVIEDEGGSGVNDSALNPGVIEQKNVSDSINDTISHEQEVANAWDERYKKMLNHK